MKKHIITLIISIMAFAACDKVYINGDLDGMWRLEMVDSCGRTEHPQGIYYSFQRHMAQVGKYYSEGIPVRYIGNMEYTGKTLTISGLRKFLEEEKECTAEELAMFFLFANDVTFNIEKLDNEILIMESNGRVYTLYNW